MQSKAMIWRQATLIRSQTLDLTPMVPPELLLYQGSIVFRTAGRIPVLEPDYFGKISVRSIVGSLRNLRLEHLRLTGVLRWASDDDAKSIQRAFEAGDLVPRLEYFVLEQMDSGRAGLMLATKWQPVSIQLRRKDGIA
jgi:hypothetical protein